MSDKPGLMAVINGQYGPRLAPSDYNTSLPLLDEMQFRRWVKENGVPFDPEAGTTDYDMRGFWQASRQQQPGILAQMNSNDGLIHYPDRFKTPIHQSFSNESQWAGPNEPGWVDGKLIAPDGRVVFDERAK